jgi:Putative bacterial sensory transduction regulator
MVDFETVKRFVQELHLAISDEYPTEGIVVVEDEERGLKHLVLNCDDPILIFEQRILDVPTRPGELFRRLLQMNRTLVHGAFVLDEAGKSILLHDTLALAHVDVNAVQGTIDAFSLALAEHAQELIAFSRHGVG